MKTAADHQREDLRQELHKAIDTLIDNWPNIQYQARTMGGGYPGDTLAGGGSGHTDGMLERTIALRQDLAERSRRWITQLDILIRLARGLTAQTTRLLPLADDEVEAARARKNTMEICARCKEPITDGKIHRIDGEPHHATTCYFQAWRERRRANAQTG